MQLYKLDASMIRLFAKLMDMYTADPSSVDPAIIEQAVAYATSTRKLKHLRKVAEAQRQAQKVSADPFAHLTQDTPVYTD